MTCLLQLVWLLWSEDTLGLTINHCSQNASNHLRYDTFSPQILQLTQPAPYLLLPPDWLSWNKDAGLPRSQRILLPSQTRRPRSRAPSHRTRLVHLQRETDAVDLTNTDLTEVGAYCCLIGTAVVALRWLCCRPRMSQASIRCAVLTLIHTRCSDVMLLAPFDWFLSFCATRPFPFPGNMAYDWSQTASLMTWTCSSCFFFMFITWTDRLQPRRSLKGRDTNQPVVPIALFYNATLSFQFLQVGVWSHRSNNVFVKESCSKEISVSSLMTHFSLVWVLPSYGLFYILIY